MFVEADGVRSGPREPEWYSFGNDVVDVTAGHLRNIHVRYPTRCEVPHAFGFAYTGQTRANRRVAVVDQVTADGVRITANVDSQALTTLAMPTFAGRVPVHGWRFHVHAVSLPDDGGSYASQPEELDVPDATFACPDLTTFCRLDELGLVVFGQGQKESWRTSPSR